MSKVLIPLALGCEELEAITLIDLLRRAEIEVTTASLDDSPVKCSRNTIIVADTTLDKVLNNDFDLMKRDRYVAAICAAPKVLLNNGILDGKNATAYPGSLDSMDTSGINLGKESIQVDGKVITSRGPGTAMDFALTLIETLEGLDTRNQVEAGLERQEP
ncbi:Protein/nucleic acid deglycase DJ-1 [Nymphon striatum]|nr:Protein/nucleic acid deglycase DJ-1 [Nymphon striatum]